MRAQHELVAVCDADTHLHPAALRLLVARLSCSPRVAAVAGAPHVTNRRNLLAAMQVLEAASIIGLIRRAQALSGHVGVVAGVLGLFRRDAVVGVGGYDPRMATEDIDLSWRLLLAGWHTAYEPRALVGMEVPTSLGALWKQRLRWARGQGEVLHLRVGGLAQLRHRWLWPLAFEAVASLLWVFALASVLVLHVVAWFLPSAHDVGGIGIAWGVAVAVVATAQVAFALTLEARYDRLALLTFLLAPVYVAAFWVVNAAAAVRSETVAIVRGPSAGGVVWDIPRERVIPPG
jgi:poly-beta-1,6-N-acetyl-D-glucosamine synthase